MHTLCVLLSCCLQKADHPDGIPECGADAMRFALVLTQHKLGDVHVICM